MENLDPKTTMIIRAIQRRQQCDQITDAYRLFNGFYEGYPGLVLDRYGSTLVIFNHGEPGEAHEIVQEITHWATNQVEWVESVLLKERQHPSQEAKNGLLIAGSRLPERISEFGVRYALDLQMNQDAGFYLDTRNLRQWLIDNVRGLRVLNTFAYTGSLGVAAGAGGAAQVVQTDLNEQFLQVARRSWVLNDLPETRCRLLPGDYFRVAGRMRNEARLFDCVILDPPFFSTTEAGTVDLQNETTRLLNKIRPLVAHEGWLVLINNALFLPGSTFMEEIDKLCQSDYLSLAEIIPVPPDVTG